MNNTNVLGQRTRKVNIDRGLAERVNREVAEEKRKAELERIKNGKKPAEEPIKVEPKVLDVDSGFITLENIVCVDAAGKVIEKYDRLDVRKDIERQANNSQVSFTPYNAIVHFEGQGLFLPSFALSCNILAALYANKSDAEVAKVLSQYKDKGNDYGWHFQNTLVNWDAEGVIHYPHSYDFIGSGGVNDINLGLERKYLLFHANDSFKDTWLWHAVKDKEYLRFLQNLTGLQDPGILTEIGDYYQRPAHIYGPTSCSESATTTSAYLGCDDKVFDITIMKRGNMHIRGVHAINYAPMM